MRPIVVHNLAAGVLLAGTLIGGSLIESLVRARSKTGRDRIVPEWGFIAVLAVKFACDALAIVIALRHVAPLPGGVWWPAIAGIALIGVGFAIRIWSVATLGRFFKLTVAIQEGHRVIDHGPYHYVRHPAYLGIIVSSIGFALITSDWIALCIMLAATTMMFAVRIRTEERALVQALGSEYLLYMRHTPRLVPGVY
ncbi:MAG TPA: isoprenylcysteine carboxylmethyltransferase family protein [Solirubrobacteraceae bacterium]|nr:isoprenylcysteine carboxylmethyltransferase family protein [Solirubrobacteraceae bacterium]